MRASYRVFVNTTAQYSRTIINTLLSLYTVRVVLSSLGESDFGIYTLVAGCVAMTGFLTNTLTVTTQRYVSYYQGKNNLELLKRVFSTCFIIHFIIGLLVVIILEAISPLLFNGFLNIPAERVHAAYVVYHMVVLILFVTVITSLFRALLVSHENIVYISMIDVLDGFLKVILVVWMSISAFDKLIFYGVIMLVLQLFILCALAFYCYYNYIECVLPKIAWIQRGMLKEMSKFAGWQVYGTICTICREQGLSLVLNRIYGTIINAGIGIGTQISSYTNFLSSAIVNAMAPQIVKAEGAGERKRAIWLSAVLSKMIFFLMSLISIPLLFEIPNILRMWLGKYPDYSVFFCRMFIIALLADSLTIGLSHINSAIGKIGKYIFLMNTPKFLTLIISIVVLTFDLPFLLIGVVFVGIEFSCSMIRVILISRQAGFKARYFYTKVILKELLPASISIVTCYFICSCFQFSWRFCMTFLTSSILYTLSMYWMGLDVKEKAVVKEMSGKFISRFLNK